MKRIISALLVFTLIIVMSIPTLAVNIDKPIYDINPEDIVYQNDIVPIYSDDMVLGTPSDETGYLLPDVSNAEIGKNVTRASATLFSMTAAKVTGLLTTAASAGKNFTPSSLTNGGLKFSGKLTNDTWYVSMIKTGVCYYDSYSGVYVAVVAEYFSNGVTCVSSWYQRLYYFGYGTGTTYYGFINNENQDGYTYGTITFYNCDS